MNNSITKEDLWELGGRIEQRFSDIEGRMAAKDDLRLFATKDDLGFSPQKWT